MLIRNATLDNQRVDLRLSAHIDAIGSLEPRGGEAVLDADGGEVLPGLHDHHVHLLALAGHRQSLDLANFASRNEIAAHLAALDGQGWVRGVNYHESMIGDLSRWDLDQLEPNRPLRLQHTSGKLWVLNSAAIETLGLDDPRLVAHDGIERDKTNTPTGRLFRMDAWLGERIGQSIPDLAATARALAAWGITSVTDTSFTNNQETRGLLEQALPQRLYCMGDESLDAGHLKIMLDDDRLPDLDELVRRIEAARAVERGVAFHCVSHVELLFALTALQMAGVRSGDRIEHAGVVRPEVRSMLRDSGCVVVTQPGFLYARGDHYLEAADPLDLPHVYPHASLLELGIPVAVSSDAPYGPADPWQVVSSAVSRRTRGGRVLGETEQVSADEALSGYLCPASDPGGEARKLAPGSSADVVVLAAPWQSTKSAPETTRVRATFIGGLCVYDSSANT